MLLLRLRSPNLLEPPRQELEKVRWTGRTSMFLTISCVPCRQPDVHDELNRTRREAVRKTSRKLWTAEEDAILYDHSDRELPTRPYVKGKTDFAVRMRMQHLRQSACPRRPDTDTDVSVSVSAQYRRQIVERLHESSLSTGVGTELVCPAQT